MFISKLFSSANKNASAKVSGALISSILITFPLRLIASPHTLPSIKIYKFIHSSPLYAIIVSGS